MKLFPNFTCHHLITRTNPFFISGIVTKMNYNEMEWSGIKFNIIVRIINFNLLTSKA